MLVDRNELEQQLFRNIESYGITTVEVAESKRDLRQILASDYRGLVVSIIHKFDDIPADINTRTSVVVLVDEAHRTTGGDLGNYLMGALPNATYIGFTGTPLTASRTVRARSRSSARTTKRAISTSTPSPNPSRTARPSRSTTRSPLELRVDRETLEREFLDLAGGRRA